MRCQEAEEIWWEQTGSSHHWGFVVSRGGNHPWQGGIIDLVSLLCRLGGGRAFSLDRAVEDIRRCEGRCLAALRCRYCALPGSVGPWSGQCIGCRRQCQL